MLKKYSLVLCILLTHVNISFSQSSTPKIGVYASIVHPIVAFSSDGPSYNFKDYYAVGFPFGINYWKTSNVGFSFELSPFIKSENGTSKMSYLLFHPGVLVALGKGYTFVGRMAFETSGRYGVTPVFNKVFARGKSCSYFIAVPLPVRFGNDKPTSASVGLQFGISF